MSAIKNLLYLKELEKHFSANAVITIDQLAHFYQSIDTNTPRATINWRAANLVKRKMLTRIGRGKFTMGARALFSPQLTRTQKKISRELKAHFPLIKYCIWSSNDVKEFQQHLSKTSYIFLDVEKEATEACYHFLKEKYTAFHKPPAALLNEYISALPEPVIVRQLITQAPGQLLDKVPTVTIEKLLVDIVADHEFHYLSQYEIHHIFNNAFDRYAINLNKLLRYAGRKNSKATIIEYLKLVNLPFVHNHIK